MEDQYENFHNINDYFQGLQPVFFNGKSYLVDKKETFDIPLFLINREKNYKDELKKYNAFYKSISENERNLEDYEDINWLFEQEDNKYNFTKKVMNEQYIFHDYEKEYNYEKDIPVFKEDKLPIQCDKDALKLKVHRDVNKEMNYRNIMINDDYKKLYFDDKYKYHMDYINYMYEHYHSRDEFKTNNDLYNKRNSLEKYYNNNLIDKRDKIKKNKNNKTELIELSDDDEKDEVEVNTFEFDENGEIKGRKLNDQIKFPLSIKNKKSNNNEIKIISNNSVNNKDILRGKIKENIFESNEKLNKIFSNYIRNNTIINPPSFKNNLCINTVINNTIINQGPKIKNYEISEVNEIKINSLDPEEKIYYDNTINALPGEIKEYDKNLSQIDEVDISIENSDIYDKESTTIFDEKSKSVNKFDIFNNDEINLDKDTVSINYQTKTDVDNLKVTKNELQNNLIHEKEQNIIIEEENEDIEKQNKINNNTTNKEINTQPLNINNKEKITIDINNKEDINSKLIEPQNNPSNINEIISSIEKLILNEGIIMKSIPKIIEIDDPKYKFKKLTKRQIEKIKENNEYYLYLEKIKKLNLSDNDLDEPKKYTLSEEIIPMLKDEKNNHNLEMCKTLLEANNVNKNKIIDLLIDDKNSKYNIGNIEKIFPEITPQDQLFPFKYDLINSDDNPGPDNIWGCLKNFIFVRFGLHTSVNNSEGELIDDLKEIFKEINLIDSVSNVVFKFNLNGKDNYISYFILNFNESNTIYGNLFKDYLMVPNSIEKSYYIRAGNYGNKNVIINNTYYCCKEKTLMEDLKNLKNYQQYKGYGLYD